MHAVTMYYLLNAWCRYSKFIMFYSFQVFLLHAYSWAVPDRRYTQWVQDTAPFFVFLSVLHMVGYVCGIAFGSYLYAESKKGVYDGVLGYFGYALTVFTLVAQTPMMVMLSITFATIAHRFDY